MTEDVPDAMHWVAAARSGDSEAGRRLVDCLYPMVIRIARRHRPLRLAEEDLAQEIFLKLFMNLGQYEPRDGIPLEHWVARLATRTCLDQLRSERRRPELRVADLKDGEQAWLDYLLERPEHAAPDSDHSAAELVDQLLARLPPEDRLVLRLLDMEQKSVLEISQLTGWSRPLVKVRAFRARHRLRKAAQQLGELPKQ